jgi:hypothetical protein
MCENHCLVVFRHVFAELSFVVCPLMRRFEAFRYFWPDSSRCLLGLRRNAQSEPMSASLR